MEVQNPENLEAVDITEVVEEIQNAFNNDDIDVLVEDGEVENVCD